MPAVRREWLVLGCGVLAIASATPLLVWQFEGSTRLALSAVALAAASVAFALVILGMRE